MMNMTQWPFRREDAQGHEEDEVQDPEADPSPVLTASGVISGPSRLRCTSRQANPIHSKLAPGRRRPDRLHVLLRHCPPSIPQGGGRVQKLPAGGHVRLPHCTKPRNRPGRDVFRARSYVFGGFVPGPNTTSRPMSASREPTTTPATCFQPKPPVPMSKVLANPEIRASATPIATRPRPTPQGRLLTSMSLPFRRLGRERRAESSLPCPARSTVELRGEFPARRNPVSPRYPGSAFPGPLVRGRRREWAPRVAGARPQGRPRRPWLGARRARWWHGRRSPTETALLRGVEASNAVWAARLRAVRIQGPFRPAGPVSGGPRQLAWLAARYSPSLSAGWRRGGGGPAETVSPSPGGAGIRFCLTADSGVEWCGDFW